MPVCSFCGQSLGNFEFQAFPSSREIHKSLTAPASCRCCRFGYNHPSGDPTPSEADIKVTRDLIRAGQLLKIEVLDHVILGHAAEGRTKDYSSLRELGYFF